MAALDNLESAIRMLPKANFIPAKSLFSMTSRAGDSWGPSVKAHQIDIIPDTHSIASIPPIAAQTVFTGQSMDYRIIKGCVQNLKDLVWQVQITETGGTNPATPVNPFFFVQYIEFWANGGNDKVQTLYPEQMLYHLGSFLTNEQQQRVCLLNGISPINYQNENPIAASGTYTFFLPLLGNFIAANDGLWVPGLANDFLVRIWLRNGIVKSGSGTLGLTKSNLLLETEVVTSAEAADHDKDYMGVVEMDYLDTTRFTISQTFTAGAQARIQLSPFIGWCSYLYYLIRASNTNVANDAILKCETQGTSTLGALVEIDSPSGIIISGNVPFFPDYYLGLETAKHFPGTFNQNLNFYPLVFGDPMAAEHKVIHKGFLNFTGTEFITLTPGSTSAETAEVTTMVPYNGIAGAAVAATSGTTWISVEGILPNGQYLSYTAGPVAYNATTASITALLLPAFSWSIGYAGQPIVCTVGGSGFNNTAGVTFTLSNLPKNYQTYSITFALTNCTLSNGTVLLTSQLTKTTAGVPQLGFNSGTYNLDVYGRFFRHCHIRNGKFEVSSIMAQ